MTEPNRDEQRQQEEAKPQPIQVSLQRKKRHLARGTMAYVTASEPTARDTKTPEVESSLKVDFDKIKRKLKEVETYYASFAGKHGYNPWFYLKQTVDPLRVRFNSGERSPDLIKAIMALEMKEPKTN